MNTDRRSIRLREFDYSTDGAYFVTICTQDRACLLGECVHGEFNPNSAGRMVESAWNELPVRFPDIQTDAFVVMPNHVHGIIILSCKGESCIRPQSPDHEGDHQDRPYMPDEWADNRRGESCIRPETPPHEGDHEDRPYVGNEYTGICTGESGIRPQSPSHQGDHEDRPYVGPSPRPRGTLPGTLGRVIQAFKSITTVSYVDGVKRHGWQAFPGRLWQRNYYEHIVRDDDELNRITEYIIGNPGQWETDQDNPSVSANLVFAPNPPANGTRTGESCIRPEPQGHGGDHEDRPYAHDKYTGVRTGESCIRPDPPPHGGDHEDRPYAGNCTGESCIRPRPRIRPEEK